MWISTGRGVAVLLLVIVVCRQAPAADKSCESLAGLPVPNTTITLAEAVPAGDFTPPAAEAEGARTVKYLPAFCRVAATLKPSPDSDIKVELWMPISNWNGKFEAVGNGGWAGVVSYSAMGRALQRGYATSSTDTGHTGNTGKFAFGHPEKYVDFAYRSEHEMTVQAKRIIDAFYGHAPRISYWNGCSTGGRQGLTEAQRFPSDFDGIIAGAAANPRIHLNIYSLWVAHAVLKNPASYIPPAKYPVIHKAAIAACDVLDGVKDGLIGDPTLCHFNPKTIECKSGDGPECLTAAQAEAARKILSPAINPRTGAEIFPGFMPGSELGWGNAAAGPDAKYYATDLFKYVVFKNPDWDWRTFNFDSDVALADKIDDNMTNAIDPNLTPFMKRGGKLLMYHGWSDPQVTPLASINYYKSVLDRMGGPQKTAQWVRLFLAPGMGHCGGGEGPDQFDVVGAIEDWVEKGKPPVQMLASHRTDGKVDRSRPLCPYPQVARYKGTGSIDDATNFVCATR